MSTDEAVTKDLIETLEDGKKGFAESAEKVADSNRPDLASTFTELSAQRSRFAEELRTMAAQYGDKIDESGSVAAALHRGWMSIKDVLAGSDPDGVIDAAIQGEDHAVSEYEKALAEDISPRLRTLVERQFADVSAARNRVKGLQVATS